ncbi:MAG: hypothetical protein WA081_22100 [Desulfosalsimonadaceae bacterium]
MTGEIRKFATLTPSKAILRGAVGEKITRIVTVVPDAQSPFEILNISVLRGTDFRYSMKETEVKGKKAYEFTLENTRTSPGRYFDQINILTDNTENNPVTIRVSGDIRPVGAASQGGGMAPGPPMPGVK